MINNFPDKNKKLSKKEKEYIKYSKIFRERFGREPYIAEPGGTREQTTEAIKICLEKNEDILDELLYTDKFAGRDIKY